MVGQSALDLDGVDVLPAGDDHVLEPVLDEDETLVVDATDVTGAEPTIGGDRLRGRLRLVVVALHQLRCAEPQFAGLPFRDIRQGVRVDDADLHLLGGLARADQPLGVGLVAVRLRREDRDRAAHLGQAVDLDEVEVGEFLERGAQQRRWHGCSAVGEGTQLTEQLDGVGAHLHDLAEHCGHQERSGGSGHQRTDQRCPVGLAGHDACHAVVNAALYVRRTADVEQRHRDHVLVVGLNLVGWASMQRVGDHVRLRQSDALGFSGGSRGVHDDADIGRGDLGTAAVRCGRGQHRLVLIAVGALGSDLDDVSDFRQPIQDRLDRRLEVGADDQQRGTGVVEDVVHLIAGEPEVDDGRSRAQ